MTRNSDIVVVDVETSGVNPFRHSILSVAFVPLDPRIRSLVVHIRPPVLEWADLAKANFAKFSSEWDRLAVEPHAACDVIESYLANVNDGERVTPCGHNVGFDIAFLRQLAFWGGRDQLANLGHRAIDSHTLLYILHLMNLVPSSALSSDGAFKHFGIEVDEAVRHTAEADASATRELLLKMLELFGADKELSSLAR